MCLCRMLKYKETQFEKTKQHFPHYENEQLCEINIDLKKAINNLREENKKLKSKYIKIEVIFYTAGFSIQRKRTR